MGAQELLGLIQVPARGQQVGQLEGGEPVAGVGAGAQLIQILALGQQVGQLEGSEPVARVGAGAQLIQIPALGSRPASREAANGSPASAACRYSRMA